MTSHGNSGDAKQLRLAIRAADVSTHSVGEAAFFHRFLAWAGCPQATVVGADETVPNDAAVVLDLADSRNDTCCDLNRGRPCWRLTAGVKPKRLSGTGQNLQLSFPDGHKVFRHQVPMFRENRWRTYASVHEPATHAWYLALKHLDKTESLPPRSRVDRVLAEIMLRRGGEIDLADQLAAAGRRHEPLPSPNQSAEELAAWVERLAHVSASIRRQVDQRLPLDPMTVASAPELLVAEVLRSGTINPTVVQEILEHARGARTVAVLVAAAVLAIQREREHRSPAIDWLTYSQLRKTMRWLKHLPRRSRRELTVYRDPRHVLRAAHQQLLEPSLLDRDRAIFRSTRDEFAASPSPIVAAVAALGRRGLLDELCTRPISSSDGGTNERPARAAKWCPELFLDVRERLGWTALPASADSADDTAWSLTVDELESVTTTWLDPQGRRIARGMLDVTRQLMRVPASRGGPIESHDVAHRPVLQVLRDAWSAAVRTMLLDAKAPWIRVHPWPAGHTSALSMRYDVDRPVARATVTSIVAGQRERLGGPCGSWYELPTHWPGSSSTPLDPADEQELALHATHHTDAESGKGTTAHSAPGSEYWQGRRTVDGHAREGAAWTEHLATQLGLPVPARHGDDDGSRWPRIALTPMHFPLEGSTSDKSAEYFDRWLDAFRTLRELGGHLILGTHPDVDQNPIDSIAVREGLDSCWSAPTGQVLERVAALLVPRAIELKAGSKPGTILIRLTGRYSQMNDVVIEIESETLTSRRVVVRSLGASQFTIDDGTPAAPETTEG